MDYTISEPIDLHYQKAIEYDQKSIDLDPKYANSWIDMGSAYSDLGDDRKAIECYKRQSTSNPIM